MTWGPLTHLQLCDDAVLIVLILDGRGHDWGCGGRAGHLGHSPAQLHLGLLHLQLLGLSLLQGPGLIRPGSVCLQPAYLLGPIPSRLSPTCPPSSASARPLPMEEAPARSRVTTGQPPFFPSTSSELGDHSRGSPEVLSGIPPTQPHTPVPYPRWGMVP